MMNGLRYGQFCLIGLFVVYCVYECNGMIKFVVDIDYFDYCIKGVFIGSQFEGKKIVNYYIIVYLKI